MTDIESLVARLGAVESSSRNMMSDGVTTNWYCNPDGPEAIAAIRTLQTEKVELREAVKTAKGAIETLDVGGLGWGEQPHETLGVNVYPLRDELLAALDQTLSNTGEME